VVTRRKRGEGMVRETDRERESGEKEGEKKERRRERERANSLVKNARSTHLEELEKNMLRKEMY